MINISSFVLGAFIGAGIGVFIMCLCFISKNKRGD